MLNEAQVIAQVRTGRTDAFGEIVDHYQTPIIRYLLRLTGSHEVAEDLAQDTFLRAYQSILKTDSELSLKAWLYKIATNNVRQYHRRRRLLSFIPLIEGGASDAAAMKAPSGGMDEKIAIQEALLKVPRERRECLVLHYVEGLRYRDIADIVGASEEAVRKRVARGSKRFREAYGPRPGGGKA